MMVLLWQQFIIPSATAIVVTTIESIHGTEPPLAVVWLEAFQAHNADNAATLKLIILF